MCSFSRKVLHFFLLQPERCYQSDLLTSPSVYVQCATSLHLSSHSERSIDAPRASFSMSSGLWLFLSSLRLQPVWPDRGRFQTSPDSDETPPVESRGCS